MALIQETKKENWDVWEVRKIWSDDDFGYSFAAAVGRFGAWSENAFEEQCSLDSRSFVMLKAKWTREDLSLCPV
ncbi:hypothetical protein GQ457_10G010580 [Hibiscus cannabinus]